jgi:hypothetical protein
LVANVLFSAVVAAPDGDEFTAHGNTPFLKHQVQFAVYSAWNNLIPPVLR